VRKWKGIVDPPLKVWTYFREHPDHFFTAEHVASQVGFGRRRTRKIINELVERGKLETVETMSRMNWGGTKRMFRSLRGTAWDCLAQAELIA
jgi:response regulator of citrate/malate metabolism